MSAGDTTQGRLVVGKEPHELQPGDYGRWARDCDNWYACTPNGLCANLAKHVVTEGADCATIDGTVFVTVSPSIEVWSGRRERPQNDKTHWHGFLERGVWREV